MTGERIRDKIAASKAKGMWMGGNLPLGYDASRDGSRTLSVNQDEAKRVCRIYTRYLDLGSVHALVRDLRSEGIVQDGEHEAIVDADLFDQVQVKLDTQVRRHRTKAKCRAIKAPLTGELFDAAGEPMSPTTSRGKSGRSHRYFVSASFQQGSRPADADCVQRVSAPEIERVVSEAVYGWVANAGDPFAILTAARTGEVLGATWDEVDMGADQWTVPAERMKAAKTHRVPLSQRAMEILETGEKLGSDNLFPGPQGGKLSGMSMSMLLRRMNIDATVHGFRSSFRDWAAEQTSYAHEATEMALAHTIGSAVERAYRRGDLFDKRRRLMEDWASYCARSEAETSYRQEK